MSISPHVPLQVTRVEHSGLSLTAESTIAKCLRGVLAARTVTEVVNGAVAAGNELKELGAFEHVQLTLDRGDAPGEAKLVIAVKEKRAVGVKLTTFVEAGGSEGGLEAQAELRNVLGLAETATVSYVTGGSTSDAGDVLAATARPLADAVVGSGSVASGAARAAASRSRRSQIRAEAAVPRFLGLRATLRASADTSAVAPPPDEPYEHVSYGVRLGLSNSVGGVEWAARERDLHPARSAADPLAYACPPEILEEARPSLKSALALHYSQDWTDPDSAVPESGGSAHGRVEWAHPSWTGGDVGLVSGSLSARQVFPLSARHGVSLAVSGELAAVSSLLDDGHVPLVDRLFLGGPFSLWGFQPRGAGPRSADGRSALGGELRWHARVALEGPPPPNQLGVRVRTHVFLAVGALSPRASADALVGSFRDARVSCGAGVAVPLGGVRVEVNAVAVLRKGRADAPMKGRLQLGVGTELS